MELKGFSIIGDETNETETGTIRHNGANNISEISTYRSNVSSNRGKDLQFNGTLKQNQSKIINDLRGGGASDKYRIDEEDDDDDDEPSDTFKQSSSIYEIHKILSSDQYTIGKSVSDYI